MYISYSVTSGHYYVGSSGDADKRLFSHNAGNVKSTKFGIPWKIVYAEKCATRQEAYKRERQIKSYKGGEAFRELIKGK